MQTNEFFKKDLIVSNLEFKDKKEVLTYFAKLLVEKKYAKNYKTVLEKALDRENQFSTGIGSGLAIPHIRDDVMNQSVILFANIKPVDWGSSDNVPVEKIFFIAMSSKEGENSHMDVIASLSRLFMNQEFVDKLKLVKSYNSLIKLIDEYTEDETKKEKEKLETEQKVESTNSAYDVVAITACPTGIAHTFMAAQRLEDGAKELGIKIKVETQGTDGPKNVLTQEDINNAKGVIIAVDKVVQLDRFAGKENVLEMGTKAVIKDPVKEIKRSLNKEGKKMDGSKSSAKSQEFGSEDLISFKGFGKKSYKAIMNGVSYMLPFVVFGGILIALSFLIDIKNAGTADYGSVLPIAKWFNLLGKLAFNIIVPILCAYIAYGMVGKFGLLPGFVCGFISIGGFVTSVDINNGNIHWMQVVSESTTKAQSGFFGGIIGAFLTAAILIVLIKYVFAYLPKSLNGVKNILFIPLFGTLIIGALFWIINIPLIYVNYGFTKFLNILQKESYLSALLGLVIGAMMAFDLGGPINKAAYVFSTVSLTQNGTSQATIAMAASMAGGMVPPIGIALSLTFFRHLWSKEDRQTNITMWIMGLSFVSEGAIPFTTKKPKLLVPANVIGGAITGLLVGALSITLSAPHGGVFVFALVRTNLFATNELNIGLGITFYVLAILAGAIAEMLAIWILTKIYDSRSKKTSENKEEQTQQLKKSWFKSLSKNKVNQNTFSNKKISYRNLKYDLHNNIFTFNRLCN